MDDNSQKGLMKEKLVNHLILTVGKRKKIKGSENLPLFGLQKDQF